MRASDMIALRVQDMQECDSKTIASGISEINLVARVADKLLECILRNISIEKGSHIAMVCGKGNNGADGYALAVLLSRQGVYVDIYADKSKTDTNIHYRKVCQEDNNISIYDLSKTQDKSKYLAVVDCLFGVGFCGQVKESYHKIIDYINSFDYIIACDIPSGLNADNGLITNKCVKADITIAVQAIKTGHILANGKDCCGKLQVIDVGIMVDCQTVNIVSDIDARACFPKRDNNSHKGSYGQVGIVACSNNSVGAGLLSVGSSLAVSEVLDNTNNTAECAMRSGAGLCKIFVPKSILPQMLYRITNAMVDTFDAFDSAKLSAVAFGMGVGLECDMLDKVLQKGVPTVLDADALNILANNKEKLKNLSKNIILTPHPLEFSRLTGMSVDNILANPIDIARSFAKTYHVVVLLKGCSTIITDGDRVAINITGSPAMAKGGSGDVLSGVIASLLARGIPTFEAGCVGSYLCGCAGEYLADKYGEYSVCASDMPLAFRDILSKYSVK